MDPIHAIHLFKHVCIQEILLSFLKALDNWFLSLSSNPKASESDELRKPEASVLLSYQLEP